MNEQLELAKIKIFNDASSFGVYSRNNLPKIKDGAYVINLDEVNKKSCTNQ